VDALAAICVSATSMNGYFESIYSVMEHSSSAALFVTLLAGALLFLVAILFRRQHRKSSRAKGSGVLILGQCDSGKTLLFYHLRGNKIDETVSSLSINHDTFNPSGCLDRSVEVVDIPGHKRMEGSIRNYLPTSRCIIYMVDSTNKESLKAAAESLYDILESPIVSDRLTSILIACNKTDLPSARQPASIMDTLSREIDKLRLSRGAVLEGESHTGGYVGEEGQMFSFDHTSCPVEMASCSVYKGEVGAVLTFLMKQYVVAK